MAEEKKKGFWASLFGRNKKQAQPAVDNMDTATQADAAATVEKTPLTEQEQTTEQEKTTENPTALFEPLNHADTVNGDSDAAAKETEKVESKADSETETQTAAPQGEAVATNETTETDEATEVAETSEIIEETTETVPQAVSQSETVLAKQEKTAENPTALFDPSNRTDTVTGDSAAAAEHTEEAESQAVAPQSEAVATNETIETIGTDEVIETAETVPQAASQSETVLVEQEKTTENPTALFESLNHADASTGDNAAAVEETEEVENKVDSQTDKQVDTQAESQADSETESSQADTQADSEAESQALVDVDTQEKPSGGGFFSRLLKGLLKTKQHIGAGFRQFFRGKKIDDELFEELEEQLLIADIGVPTTNKIIQRLTDHADRKQLQDAELLYQQLKTELGDILKPVAQPLQLDGSKKPYVILMVGVNGVGKTTTIGKLARQFQQEGKSVMLAAGDTFRAAAVEQLQVWGERNRIPVVAQATGADSASVIFDAMQSAAAKGIDVLIADTAGRLQNKNNLMDELKKIVRVMKKYDDTAPHEIMLTLDAGTGQNAVSQAKLFNEAVGLTGITLTKLDGTAKGGVIFAIADQFNLPIRYIGVGEKIEDLREFQAEEFIDALFTHDDQAHAD